MIQTTLVIVSLLFITVSIFSQTVTGSRWLLESIDGKSVGETKAFIVIDSERSRLTGHTGCNRLFGTIEGHGRQKHFSNIRITEMACLDRAASEIERKLIIALREVSEMSLEAGHLTLFDGDRATLEFSAQYATTAGIPPIGLQGVQWMLRSIAGEEIGINEPFIRFDEKKGSVGGNTGCNVFGGSYSTHEGSIAITEMISTMRACEADGRMSIERRFLDALQKAHRFKIADGRLFLFNGKDLLLKFAARD